MSFTKHKVLKNGTDTAAHHGNQSQAALLFSRCLIMAKFNVLASTLLVADIAMV